MLKHEDETLLVVMVFTDLFTFSGTLDMFAESWTGEESRIKAEIIAIRIGIKYNAALREFI